MFCCELCYIVIVICLVSRRPFLADWACFPPPQLAQIDLSLLTCREIIINQSILCHVCLRAVRTLPQFLPHSIPRCRLARLRVHSSIPARRRSTHSNNQCSTTPFSTNRWCEILQCCASSSWMRIDSFSWRYVSLIRYAVTAACNSGQRLQTFESIIAVVQQYHLVAF